MDAKQLLDEVLNKITALSQERDALKAELDAMKKPVEAKPVFEVGKSYRTRGGGVALIERFIWDDVYQLKGRIGEKATSWTKDGVLEIWVAESPNDLLPGEVIVWKAPASLPDGVWRFCKDNWLVDGESQAALLSSKLAQRTYKDWTDPPKSGKWRVTGGIGVWEGE